MKMLSKSPGNPKLFIVIILSPKCPLRNVASFILEKCRWNGSFNLFSASAFSGDNGRVKVFTTGRFCAANVRNATKKDTGKWILNIGNGKSTGELKIQKFVFNVIVDGKNSIYTPATRYYSWRQSFQTVLIEYLYFGLDKSWFHNMSAGETIIFSHNAPKHLTSCKVDTPKVEGMLHISNPSNPSTDIAR